ncbi:MAG: threonylcarbamoyl-AMP synthase [Clostridia bacterium]|nr:threonylcarbamoyl-AMP synthase [Clostridia bacterium]
MISKYSNQTEQINEEEIKEAAQKIKEGEIVLFPTETVYGLGANAMNAEAVKKIFEAKGRASDNPLIVHVSNLIMLKQIVENIGEIEQKLIQTFWPGPLTIIFPRKSEQIIPNITTAGLDTVGVRMPSNLIAQKLIEYAGVPIAAPSANVSGKPSGTKIEDILQEFDGKVAYILDGGFVDIGVESTVIQVKKNTIHLLRPGKITKEQLEQIAKVEVDSHVLGKVEKTEVVASPGMKYRHYAPNTKCMMIYSKEPQKMIDKINEIIRKKQDENQTVLVLGRKQHLNKYIANKKWNMGETLDEVAKNIFTLLRQVDKENVDLVIIEGVGQQKLGLAITNRLIRACEYNYIVIE